MVGNLAIVSATDYSVTVKATSNAGSVGKIKADFGNGIIYEKQIWVGVPGGYNAIQMLGAYDWVRTNYLPLTYSVPPTPTATSYRWTLSWDTFSPSCPTINPKKAKITGGVLTNTPQGDIWTFNTPNPYATIEFGNCSGSYDITCEAVNDCGISYYASKSTGVSKTSPCNGSLIPVASKLAVYPNPVKDGTITVNVSANDVPCNYPPTTSGKMGVYISKDIRVQIYDMYGNQVFENSYPDEETFSIKGLTLKPANYILHVSQNGQTSKQIIIVE